MTEQEYASQALAETANRLDRQGIETLDATVAQAWFAFESYLADYPLSVVAQQYAEFGKFYRENFPALWAWFQFQVYSAIVGEENA